MKNVFKIVAVASTLALSVNIAQANDKIGFADPGYLLQNHPEMVEVAKKIEKMVEASKTKFADEEKKLSEEDKSLSAEFKKIEEDAQKLQKEQGSLEASLKKKIAALEKEAPRLRSKEIQSRQNAIQAEQKAFQNKVSALQKRETELRKKADAFQQKVVAFQEKVQKEQSEASLNTEEIQKKAVDDINATIKSVAEAKGYTLVLLPSAALYAKDESADITEVVLDAIKAKVSSLQKAEEKPADKPAETQAK